MSGERVRELIPFVHVTDIARSNDFYELLGFELKDTHQYAGRLEGAAPESGDAQLMLARASASDRARPRSRPLLPLHRNLAALRDHLLANGVAVGEIADGSPRPAREMGLGDPDGWCLMVAEIE